MERPRLKRTAEQIEAPDGSLVFIRTGANDVEIERPDEEERQLLAALDGTSQLDELRARFGATRVDEAVESLCAVDLLEDAAPYESLDPAVLTRFDRQLRYFSDVGRSEGVSPAKCQERLRAAHVLILGVGGLGGRVALDLACSGVGKLTLVDGDRVEESNLNRQIQFTEADVGSRKVEVTAARLAALNSELEAIPIAEQMESQNEISRHLGGVDLVVDAADWPPHELEYWCNAACFDADVPYIAMSHFPPVVRLGPLYVPGATGCFLCQDTRYRAEFPLYDSAIEQLRDRRSPAAMLGAACGVAGGLVATEAIHYLTGIVPPPMLGAGFVLDLRTLAIESYAVEAEDDCPVCRPLTQAA